MKKKEARATVLLQARTGSKRLPGKVLRPAAGRPMLWYTVRTLQLSPGVEKIVLATTELAADDVLVEAAAAWGIATFRGPEEDVLARLAAAARQFPAGYYLRATGDNPVLDLNNPLRSLNFLLNEKLDYCAEKGLPVGSIVEVFTAEALQKADREAVLPADREHVTLYMKRSPSFRRAFPQAPDELCFPELSLTVDTRADFERAAFILEKLYRKGIPPFAEVLALCRENPALTGRNTLL